MFITKDGFKGILGYNCTKSSIDEIKNVFAQLTRNDIDGEHIVFPVIPMKSLWIKLGIRQLQTPLDMVGLTTAEIYIKTGMVRKKPRESQITETSFLS